MRILLSILLVLSVFSVPVAAGFQDSVRLFLDVKASKDLSGRHEALNFGTSSNPKFVILNTIGPDAFDSVPDGFPALDLATVDMGVSYRPGPWSACAFVPDWSHGEHSREYFCSDSFGVIDDALCVDAGLIKDSPETEVCDAGYDGSGLAGLAATVKSSGTYPCAFKGSGFDVELATSSGGTLSGMFGTSAIDGPTLLVRVNGDATVPAGALVTSSVRRKGMVLYVDGDLTINGTVSMTARGAHAAGENLAVRPGTTISAVGGAGGGKVTAKLGQNVMGLAGGSGEGLACGGGGGGGARSCCSQVAVSGTGSAGTSYSGGSGGGGALVGGVNVFSGATAGNAWANGGQGGAGARNNSTSAEADRPNPGGGAGNPGGSSPAGQSYFGDSGSGGLLIIVTTGNLTIGSSGTVESRGFGGADGHLYGDGGGSGGGSVILLHGGAYSNGGVIDVSGGVRSGGGAGGSGSFFHDHYVVPSWQ